MIRFLLVSLCSISLLWGDDFMQERLLSLYSSGNPAYIEQFCLKETLGIIDQRKLDEATIKNHLDNKNLRRACFMYHFFAPLKKEGAITLKELKNRDFSKWLIAHPEIFEKLVFAGKNNKKTLETLYKLWEMEGKKLSGISLDMALGAAASASETPWVDCLEKYLFFQKSHAQKKLLPQFEKLEPWEMSLLFGGNDTLDELKWGQEYLVTRKVTPDNIANIACSLIPYRMNNKKGISVHSGGAFYDNKPITLQIFVEYGGVCGAVSTAACKFLRSKGIPSYTIGQPGHCALLWKGSDGSWRIGNNIYGWNWSSGKSLPHWNASVSAIYTLSEFQKNKNTTTSNLCFYLSRLTRRQENIIFLLEQAVKENASNLPAWQTYVTLKAANANDSELSALLKAVREALPNDPYALKIMVNQIITPKVRKKLSFSFCPLFLTHDESGDSFDNFMREFWPLAVQEVSILKKGPQFDEKNRRVFLKKWIEHFKETPNRGNNMEKMSQVMEKTIVSLLEYEKTCDKFLSQYGELLQIWNNEKAYSRAIIFVKNCLEKTSNTNSLKSLNQAGLDWAMKAKDKRMISFFTDRVGTPHPSL